MPEFITVTLIVIAAVILLAVASLGAVLSLRGVLTIAYNGELSIHYRVLFLKLPIYPFAKKKKKKRKCWHMSAKEAARIREQQRKKEERRQRFLSYFKGQKATEEKEPTQKSTTEKSSQPTKTELGDILTDTVDIISSLTEIIAVVVKRFTHHLRIKVARFKVKVATEDAALTAVTYGAVSQIINVLIPILSDVKNFDLPKRKNFDIRADFTTTTPDIDVEVSFYLRVWHVADIGIRSLFGGMSKLFSRRKNAKYPIPYINKPLSEILEGLSGSGQQKKEEN